MSFELAIALRYLVAQRRQLFISVISAISTLGVIVGVMILLIVLALFTGLQGELRSRILGTLPHLSIYRYDGVAFEDYREVEARVRSLEGVEGVSAAIYGKALVSSGTSSALVTLKGIDPRFEGTVTEFGEKMFSGDLMALEPVEGQEGESSLPGIVLGDELAMNLGVFTGETLKVMSPEGHLAPFGMLPRTRTYRVAGIFRLGLFTYDESFALLSLQEAQRMLGLGDEVHYVETKVSDIYDVETVEAEVQSFLGENYRSSNWKESNRALFSAFWLEKTAAAIAISLIFGVAALNIVASQIMIVMNKTRDIAILRSMGATVQSIRRIFMLQGIIVGVAGTAVGAALGASICYVLDRYRLVSIPEDVYQVAYVPFQLLLSDFTLVVLAAPLVCFLATIYPASRAAKLVITDALRFE